MTNATRERLLDVAQALYEQDGADAMSFRAIASLAGCSHTKAYSYFTSKADIIDALRVRAYEWVLSTLSTAAALHDDPMCALRGLAEAYIREGVARPRMYELLYTATGEADEEDPRLMEAKTAALGVCADVIDAAATEAGVEFVVDPLTAAHIFWAGAHGVVDLELGGFLVVGRSLDDLLPVALSTLISGLTKEALP
ncbi:MAG: TetR/AcrR family transcriptional regulator [Actinomycetota bacterium]